MIEIPEYVRRCFERLESAGYQAWMVGGCVRDALLGLTPADYDLCTDAKPAQLKALFSDYRLVLSGEKHGTVSVATAGGLVEITTFRTEGGYRDNRHPDWVAFAGDVIADLGRRDFTINAMAWSPARGLVDPYDGYDDLAVRRLRCVGNPDTRFREDALRILRGVRFTIRYGLTPEKTTMDAMLADRHLLDNLARERVFEELCKLLPHARTDELLFFAPVFAAAIPELEPMIGFEQHSPHHAYDVYTHTVMVCTALPGDLTLRWAGLLHDTGKPATFTRDANGRGHFYGHAAQSAAIADTVLRRLKAPTRLREDVVRLVENHMVRIEPEKKAVRRWMAKLGSEDFFRLLTLQRADMGGKGVHEPGEMEIFDRLEALANEAEAENACLRLCDLAVNGDDLLEAGFPPGKTLGDCLHALLAQVIDGVLPNEKEALLKAAVLWRNTL